jgi:hypothetical protein
VNAIGERAVGLVDGLSSEWPTLTAALLWRMYGLFFQMLDLEDLVLDSRALEAITLRAVHPTLKNLATPSKIFCAAI